MMRKVYKYPLRDFPGEFCLQMHDQARPLYVALQNGTPCLWAQIDEAMPIVQRRFVILGTGHEIPESALFHVGTWQQGPFVFHLFHMMDKESSHANAG